jgi:hypothetical protein
MSNKFLLIVGLILLTLGIFKPTFILSNNNTTPNNVLENYVIDAPANSLILDKAKEVIALMQNISDSTKKSDCLKLSALYSDIATLIAINDENQVITKTQEIKQANSLCGTMLRLNIKDKYPNLAETSRDVVISVIGDDDILLDDESRAKAVEAFRALSWAFYESSK